VSYGGYMPKHLTVVYDVTKWSDEDVQATYADTGVYMAWGHVPYERDSLAEQLREANEALEFFKDKCHRLEKHM
jgi:hypothetical protein